MITEPNYQPEPPSNQPEDIVEDGLKLSSQEMSRALLNDLLEAIPKAIEDCEESWDKQAVMALNRLSDCYYAYTKHKESLEEM